MKRKLIFGLMAALLSVILSACSINVGKHTAGVNRVEDKSEKVMNAGNIKALDVVSPVGTINVNTWDKSEIRVSITKVNHGFKSNAELLDELKNAEIIIKEENEKLTVKAFLPKFKDNGISIDFDISVPKKLASYNIDSQVGNVKMANIEGQMDVVNNVGKIDVENCTGKISLKAVTGDVTVRNCSLKDGSNLTSNVGRVLFDGSIDSKGAYKITTNTGKMDVTLPQNSAFEVDAATNVGSVDCAFNVSGSQNNKSIKGKVNGGGPQLVLVNNVGSISINKK